MWLKIIEISKSTNSQSLMKNVNVVYKFVITAFEKRSPGWLTTSCCVTTLTRWSGSAQAFNLKIAGAYHVKSSSRPIQGTCFPTEKPKIGTFLVYDLKRS